MRTNLAIAALVFPMAQAVVFGAGLLVLLALGAPQAAFAPVIAATFVVSAPIAVLIAPRLRSRSWKRRQRLRLVHAVQTSPRN
ncbi:MULTISPECIES: hypothetical protein [unclassified Phenylobacterium]|uniref:hypothetical protein n=1 Tax=unclassified Phenylobacterium TaxID=2640670 RepID=UPI000839E690|nr:MULTISPECIES: hypothetical protein [unclassified Phenylobacterium]